MCTTFSPPVATFTEQRIPHEKSRETRLRQPRLAQRFNTLSERQKPVANRPVADFNLRTVGDLRRNLPVAPSLDATPLREPLPLLPQPLLVAGLGLPRASDERPL